MTSTAGHVQGNGTKTASYGGLCASLCTMDPLLDPRPAARKPRPKFGYVPSSDPPVQLPPLAPIQRVLQLNAVVLYVGQQKHSLLSTHHTDKGVIVDGPKTAYHLGISKAVRTAGGDPNEMFWDVQWANRTAKQRCWTPESSLRVA